MTERDSRLILVIDDEASVLMALGLLLETWGFRVVTAEAEDEAVDRLNALGEPPTAILADYRLREGRTGLQAIDRIRRLCAADVPGLVITGDTSSDALRDARANGMTVLQKPVPPPHLHTVLMQMLPQPGR
ncbi:response regulator [Azospirillum halopraeferens]|uniref:response regulator n=1 Tax=Azospirillum halopraeferens TaxID=34010 RepID=UPI0012EC8C3B|nr:response regulator [Azospirillum halopraeferens]